jgi:DNA-binding helix-hairpin-helix protein with protein kinase domain
MAVVTLDPNSRDLPRQLKIEDKYAHWGGEGGIFFSKNGRYAVKIYRNPDDKAKGRLKEVIDLGHNLTGLRKKGMRLAWPLGIVTQKDSEPCLGCVMPRVPSSYKKIYLLICRPQEAVKQFKQGRSWVEYLKMARGTAGAIRIVHNTGIIPCDISFNNILANPDTGEIALIDLDSLMVEGFLPPRVYGTPRFRAPEIVMGISDPSEKSDRHALAVLLLWTMLFRNVMQPPVTACYAEDPVEDEQLGWGKKACFSEHPTTRRHYSPKIGVPLYRRGALSYQTLTPQLQELTKQALIDGLFDPPKRPAASEWEKALAEAYDALYGCSNCNQSYLYPFWRPSRARRCPFCGERVQSPSPTVGLLMEGRSQGMHVSVRHIVLYHGLPIFADIAEPGQRPPFTRRGTPIIGQVVWDNHESIHRLVNRGDTPWQVLDGGSGTVRAGYSVALRPELLLSLGAGKRLVKIVE